MRRSLGAALALSAGLVAGCAVSDEPDGGPLVDRIDDAIFAVESFYAAPQDFFEISATEERVSVIVAVDGATSAEVAFWDLEGGLVEPVPLGEPGAASGSTFRATDLVFDPDDVFDELREELPDAVIVDFAIVGGPDGIVRDARVVSASGGSLLVLLGPEGEILGVQDAAPEGGTTPEE